MGFFKNLLRLPSGTPGYMIRTETGRCEVKAIVVKRVLKFWAKILDMEEDRIPRLIYNKLVNLSEYPAHEIRYNWAAQVKDILVSNGFEEVWVNAQNDSSIIFLNMDRIIEKINNDSVQNDLNRVTHSSYSNIYKYLKHIPGRESYLDYDISLNKLRVMAQSRLSGLKFLRLISYNQRHTFYPDNLCTICNLNEKEDLFHVLTRCQAYSPVREHFYPKIPFTSVYTFYGLMEITNEIDIHKYHNFVNTILKIRAFHLNE